MLDGEPNGSTVGGVPVEDIPTVNGGGGEPGGISVDESLKPITRVEVLPLPGFWLAVGLGFALELELGG
jgi:hypothetical protein